MRVDWCERERDFCLVCVVVVSYQEYSLTHTLARSPIPTIRRWAPFGARFRDVSQAPTDTPNVAHCTCHNAIASTSF